MQNVIAYWHSVPLRQLWLVIFIAALGYSLRYLLTVGASKWLKLRGLLPPGITLKHKLYPSMLLVILSLLLELAVPLLDLPDRLDEIFSHAFQLTFIIGITWFFMSIASLTQIILYEVYDVSGTDNLRQRRMRTQIGFIYRLAVAAVCIFGLSAMLLSFDGARRIGASLIASAGIASVVIGFAAQKSLANLIAGFQIAFTQPLRIDDAVVVEKESGRVEEITLTHVVIKLWDLRRLILPITYFVEKPFENWTRSSTNLLGTVFLYADYQLPVQELRGELRKWIESHPLWDHQTCTMQVTALTASAMEIRAVLSSRNSSDNFDLRCDAREWLITLMQKKYSAFLPRVRNEAVPVV